jgi:hypothetical protein
MTTTPTPASQPRYWNDHGPERSDKDAERAQVVIDTARADGTTVRPETARKIVAALAAKAQESAPSSNDVELRVGPMSAFRQVTIIKDGERLPFTYYSVEDLIGFGKACVLADRRATAGTTAAPAQLESALARVAALSKAGMDLTARIVLYSPIEVNGIDYVRRDSMMDAVVDWRKAFDSAPKVERATAGNAAPTDPTMCPSCRQPKLVFSHQDERARHFKCAACLNLAYQPAASNTATAAPGDLPPLQVFKMAKLEVGHPSHYVGEFVRLSDVQACIASNAGAGPVPKWAGEFTSHQQWVNKAQSWLKSPGYKPAICVDAKNRRCVIGADMKRAHEENAFPVRYFWDFEEAAPSNPPAGATQENKNG